MTTTELAQFESELEKRGYRKYTSGLSSNEDYGWFLTYRDDDNNLQYMIEFRVWNFGKYPTFPNKEDPYSIDILILEGGSDTRIDLLLSHPKFTIEQAEEIAKGFHEFMQPHLINK